MDRENQKTQESQNETTFHEKNHNVIDKRKVSLLIKWKEQRIRRKAAIELEKLKLENVALKKRDHEVEKKVLEIHKKNHLETTPEKKGKETLRQGPEAVKKQLLFSEAS